LLFFSRTQISSRVRSTAGAEICSSTTAPCVVLPPASMQSCILCIHAIHGVHAGGTIPWMGEIDHVGNTRSRAMPPQGWSMGRAIADDCMDVGGRAMQEQLPSAYLFRPANGTHSVPYEAVSLRIGWLKQVFYANRGALDFLSRTQVHSKLQGSWGSPLSY
jgi:hypothetical protein